MTMTTPSDLLHARQAQAIGYMCITAGTSPDGVDALRQAIAAYATARDMCLLEVFTETHGAATSAFADTQLATQLQDALHDHGVPSDVFPLASGRVAVSVGPGLMPVTDGEHICWPIPGSAAEACPGPGCTGRRGWPLSGSPPRPPRNPPGRRWTRPQ